MKVEAYPLALTPALSLRERVPCSQHTLRERHPFSQREKGPGDEGESRP
jgi:hypothetical protein